MLPTITAIPVIYPPILAGQRKACKIAVYNVLISDFAGMQP
jgi:hypothetical protein